MLKIFASKRQWNRWSLTGKASYVGAWIGVAGLFLGVVFYIWPSGSPPSQVQTTTGSQSPIINSKTTVSLTYGTPDATNAGKILQKLNEMGSNLPVALARAVEEKLNLMDTNRVRVEALLKEKEALMAQRDSDKQALAEKNQELTNAAAMIQQLKAKLEAIVPIQQLSASDQARVTNAVARAEQVLVASARIGGGARLGGGARVGQ